jgi:hypothetical protein
VNAVLNQNMVSEATRLTRAGRLAEATALLQRMVQGESAPEPSDSHARLAPARLEPPTIDGKANVVEEKQSRPTTRVSSAPLRRKSAARFEGLKDFPGLNLRGPMTRAPPATADIAAGGTRFIGGTFRSADGSRNTGCSSQAASRKNRPPWWSCFTAAPSRRTTSRPAPG